MDRIAEWRPVEPAGPDGTAETEEAAAENEHATPAAKTAPTKTEGTASWRLVGPALIALTVVGFAVAAAIGLLVMSSMPKSAVAIDSHETPPAPSGFASPRASSAATIGGAGELVIDVEGAVAKAGVWRLAAGSRVGDAIAAAGGYSAQIDIAAATTKLNLAEVLTDGQQIHVPLLGEASPTQAAGTTAPQGSAAASGGLIDVNTATADQLDSLPGIGPVTAAKIIGARPFASIDDLQQRGVVGASVLEKIRALITVGP